MVRFDFGWRLLVVCLLIWRGGGEIMVVDGVAVSRFVRPKTRQHRVAFWWFGNGGGAGTVAAIEVELWYKSVCDQLFGRFATNYWLICDQILWLGLSGMKSVVTN